MAKAMSYAAMSADFNQYHKNALNVALHLVTTPAGYLGVLGLLAGQVSAQAAEGAAGLYCLSLLLALPLKLWAANTAAMAGIVYLATRMELGLTPFSCAALVAFSYLGQDVSHWLTGEATYQSTYEKKAGALSMLLQHTYFLLPCVLGAIPHMDTTFLYWLVASNHVVYGKVSAPADREKLSFMRQWVLDQKPSTEHTTHWWYNKLPADAHAAFTYLCTCDPVIGMFREKYPANLWEVEVIPGMNEIYVASEKHKSNSDTVFYMQHIDGPWYLMPFCGAYRCILAVNKNERIQTAFPMIPVAHTLSDGEVVGFDFNREIHYILNNPGTKNVEPRITLKLHYVIYPKCLKPLGKLLSALTTGYDIAARNLFLATIKPKGMIWEFMAQMILIVTNGVFLAEKYVGYNNLVYLAVAALATVYVHPLAFLVMTSYMHYLMYIATYQQRTNVSFGLFKRNVLVFKTLAMSQLAYFYLSNFEFDPVSLAMIAVGYFIAISATVAIGVDRTYFGVELGVYEPKWVSSFPYNCIPHPMIVGAIMGLAGVHKMAGMREAMPWLVPGHIALYALHMAQEAIAGYPTESTVKKVN